VSVLQNLTSISIKHPTGGACYGHRFWLHAFHYRGKAACL
jgi:hypothetical protein